MSQNICIEEEYDVVVVGAGHAGCEAALACARLGMKTILFTISMDSVALMPCNPNIGGSSKGHLVREIDALGGEMGKNIDKTYIQSKMLNVSKGPAVHSLRAQADKVEYTKQMRLTLQNTENLTLRQAEVSELLYEENNTDGEARKVISGVKTYSGASYYAKAVILCTGTYLKARCIYGDVVNHTGPNGLMAANHLSESMKETKRRWLEPAMVKKSLICRYGSPHISFSSNSCASLGSLNSTTLPLANLMAASPERAWLMPPTILVSNMIPQTFSVLTSLPLESPPSMSVIKTPPRFVFDGIAYCFLLL